MTDRSIPFSAPMVRAILDGRKTMTRRVLKRPTDHFHGSYTEAYINIDGALIWWNGDTARNTRQSHLPYAVGDRLWVREALERANGEAVGYPADGTWLPNAQWHWKRAHLPSRFMPRWASRITLEVTGVRVERLQNISGEDTISEGVHCPTCEAMKVSACHDSGCFHSHQLFRDLWTSLHGPGAWEANPWVAVIEFRRAQA